MLHPRQRERGRRGSLALGLELVLLLLLLAAGGVGLWQLNRPLPGAAALLVTDIPADAVRIDARGPLAYRRGHLEGARQLWSRSLLDWEGDVPGSLAAPEVLAEKLQQLGLEPGQEIVVYDDGDAGDAALVLLVLRAFGLDARLLDGGLAGFLQRGGDTTTATTPPWQPSNVALSFDRRLLGDATEAQQHLAENAIAPLDVRAADAYMRGHLSGAVNLPAEVLLPGGRLPRWSALDSRLRRAALPPERHPFLYGSDLNEAARAYLALAGYGFPHLHVARTPYPGLVAAGLPITQEVATAAVSAPSSSVCWR